MSEKNFKLVSPGVFINEIDNSFIPRSPSAIGPVIIGRAQRGPAMQPVRVESFSEFVNVFGDTVPGNGGGDIYRNGNLQSPMYGTYAAKAFLASGVAPVTYVRLLGQENSVGSAAGGAAAAGWQTTGKPITGSDGGAYGLWVFASGSVATGTTLEGHLAAVWYVQSGSVALCGNIAGAQASTAVVTASSTMIKSDANGNFKVRISGITKGVSATSFNFDDSSDLFARKRFNTNPQITSGQGDFYPSASYQDYWLGETFEQELRERGLTGGSTGVLYGVIAGIISGSTAAPSNMKSVPSQDAVAGWFIGQDLGAAAAFEIKDAQKLFRLIGLGHGEWLQKNVKVSIEKVRGSSVSTSDYGTFSVVLRSMSDSDSNIVVLERYDNLTLDPTSPNYIARVIGDQYQQWSSSDRRLKTYGEYPNQSRFIRVEMNTDVDAGATDASLLPFGYFGPPKLRDVSSLPASGAVAQIAQRFIKLGSGLPGYTSDGSGLPMISSSFGANGDGASAFLTASLNFPSVRLRLSASDGGLSDPRDAYWGFQTTRTANSTRYDASCPDTLRLWYAGLGQSSGVPADATATSYQASASSGIEGYSYIFSLDNVESATAGYYYLSGSRKAERSVTAGGSYSTLLDAGYNRFTAPFWGGFDGVDITVPDPFYNKGITDITSPSEDNSYAYHTIKRAIDTVADPESVDMNLLSVPGLTVDGLTTHEVDVCGARGDAMALIDLPNVYIPTHEAYYADKASRIGTTPTSAATALRNRQIDSSYGCTFYPWVQTRDSGTGQLVWIPPTVAMLGVLASSERSSQLWYAPAGFNRGGLSNGAAGIPVTNVTERLVSKDRDLLYEANINPIASFPSSGIVVFGQKTLQERQSALDRINVRRLVIYLKKQISLLSTQVLFDQNVQSTWNRFKGLIEPLLANTKVQYGISDYRLILDESTTTPDLIDQNIMYAKIMVKPARAIEYIAIDFVIASTGASFDD